MSTRLLGGIAQFQFMVNFPGSRNQGDGTMLKVIQGIRASLFPKEMDAMFRNRAATFSDRLGWNVRVTGGHERDEFDDANPIYLVSVDPYTNKYWGSMRLLPTTGPNMLRDVFPFLLEDGDVVESATIWEGSRICAVATEGQPERTRNGVNLAVGELLAGGGEIAIAAGLTQLVCVCDVRMYRVFRAAGCNPQIVGKPRRIDRTMSFAVLFDVGEGPLRAIQNACGIGGSVLEPEVRELVAA
jgi:N-acyl-L-homoserine lactone synthetase